MLKALLGEVETASGSASINPQYVEASNIKILNKCLFVCKLLSISYWQIE